MSVSAGDEGGQAGKRKEEGVAALDLLKEELVPGVDWHN